MRNIKTVYIVEDDDAVRDSLVMLVESVGLNAVDFPTAVDFLESYQPDFAGCLVLDIRMPGMSGIQLQQELNEKNIQLPIIFITGHGDIPMAVKAVKAGAIDFIAKPFRDQDLLDCIQYALANYNDQYDSLMEQNAIKDNYNSLTPREQEVFGLLVEGKANKVIAIDLDLSQRTVEVHRSRVMEKMAARSLADLVKMGTLLGWG